MSLPSRTTASNQAFPALPHGAARLALKRALLGIVLLSLFVSAGAWLMHAGIEADADVPALAGEQVSSAAGVLHR